MFLKKNTHNFEPGPDSDGAQGFNQQEGTQTKTNLTNTANDLLEFRIFAITNGYKYLSRIIEPVVKETLNLAHNLDEKYASSDLIKKHALREVAEGSDIDLSTSELDCLKLCSIGKTGQEIAIELRIQESTVIFQMKSARQKLNTRTDAHSVAKVIRLKII